MEDIQEDSSDLKCQLHFAKEESALMCKKLTKLVKGSEAMKEELAKYRSLYGDVNASLTVEEVADSPHTREAEIRVHLKLVEEEANLLSRRIVELEMENRGLRAEMDDMKGTQGGNNRTRDLGNLSCTETGLMTLETGKGPTNLGGEFPGVHMERQVLHGQPHFLAWHVDWCWTVVAICCGLHLFLTPEKHPPSSSPDLSAPSSHGVS
ncbi:hypothetical protein L3Q82_003413 [Scortum barcoo]|uniref:Uncharacterized protein n=1 Tax=Scortum barcoo TaxID=214431 RepID=A0ACB8VMH2_9TELE|nr:hypothetical protein L3Q82_003413 [Scortum barcoo]